MKLFCREQLHQFLGLIAILIVQTMGCNLSNSQEPQQKRESTTACCLKSVAWMQASAEYKALTIQAYTIAGLLMKTALEDPSWEALDKESLSLANRSEDKQGLPPAIIFDVDETILDNSAYEAWLDSQAKGFSPDTWKAWCKQENAQAAPGAVDFTRMAKEKNVKLFFITNRDHSMEEATRRNLKQLGFPLEDDWDNLLSKNERKSWTSNKVFRRAFVAKNHRVILIIGDNFYDFTTGFGYQSDYKQIQRDVQTTKDNWGKYWIILPNPVYGSWYQAILEYRNELTDDQIRAMMEASLHVWVHR